jgi:hypothetical protein
MPEYVADGPRGRLVRGEADANGTRGPLTAQGDAQVVARRTIGRGGKEDEDVTIEMGSRRPDWGNERGPMAGVGPARPNGLDQLASFGLVGGW